MSQEPGQLAMVVVPTFDPTLTASVVAAADTLLELGPLRIVSNSHAARAVPKPRSIEVQPDRNLAFGGAANLAADTERGSTIGMLLMNDDVRFGPDTLEAIRTLLDSSARSSLITFGRVDGSCTPPGWIGVLARLSGLWALRKYLPHQLRGGQIPFYAVFIGWDVWDRVEGFDTDRYPLYFEDSDFIKRSGVRSILVAPVGIEHDRSSTSRSHVETIPNLAYGGFHYLVDHCGWGSQVAGLAVRVAMLIRAVVELATGSSPRARESLRTAAGGLHVKPTLPAYDRFGRAV